MSRIAGRFAELRAHGRKGLIPYICAGDPSRALTVPLMHALVRVGADVPDYVRVLFHDTAANGIYTEVAGYDEARIAEGIRYLP